MLLPIYVLVLQTFVAYAKPTLKVLIANTTYARKRIETAVVKKHIFFENNWPQRPVSIELAARYSLTFTSVVLESRLCSIVIDTF